MLLLVLLDCWRASFLKIKHGGLNNENAVVFDTGPGNLLLPRRLVVRLRNHILMHNSQGGLMAIDPNMIPLALMVPFLYDGSLFTRERVWQRRFDRAERKRRRYTGAEIQDIRDKARARL